MVSRGVVSKLEFPRVMAIAGGVCKLARGVEIVGVGIAKLGLLAIGLKLFASVLGIFSLLSKLGFPRFLF